MSTEFDTSSGDRAYADERRDDRRDDRPDAGRDGHVDTGRDDEPGRYTRQHGDHAGQHDHDAGQDSVSVLDPSASERLRNRWQEVQAGFVDEPRQSVTEADQLVGEVLDEVSRVFRDQRSELEAEWSGNAEPGTEELRQALRRYREFFDRLLSL
ncbi:hypothetical protein WCD74_15220 [Actinomycetospora sp. OC33-EN08]|uniref:Uncharacterized protein n=1 Tax=Actinomycetospora aurantiaca TaxID=3129233 RepID=A0ABU8MRR0_9PSEU